MSPLRSQGDIYICDTCGTSQQEPLHSDWFEVARPNGALAVRMDDWWQLPRYFCSTVCLQKKLAQ